MARIVQGGDEIFLTLAFEFLLGGLEARDPGDDFFSLQCGVVLRFGHAHPSFRAVDSCPASIGAVDWGANWDEAVQDCDGHASTSRWIRSASSLWLAPLPDSEQETGGLHGEDRPGFTGH